MGFAFLCFVVVLGLATALYAVISHSKIDEFDMVFGGSGDEYR
jgi:hypothetical protein